MDQAEYLTLCRRLATHFVCQSADQAGVVWAKLKSFPSWPAQVLSEAAVEEGWMAGAKRPKGEVAPVMFFKDRTITWLPKRDMTSWAVGMQKRHFIAKPVWEAVREVHAMLGWESRSAPKGWWCQPPPLDTAAAARAAAEPLPELPSAAAKREAVPKKAQPPAAAAPVVATGSDGGAAAVAAAGSSEGEWAGEEGQRSASGGQAESLEAGGSGEGESNAAPLPQPMDVSGEEAAGEGGTGLPSEPPAAQEAEEGRGSADLAMLIAGPAMAAAADGRGGTASEGADSMEVGAEAADVAAGAATTLAECPEGAWPGASEGVASMEVDGRVVEEVAGAGEAADTEGAADVAGRERGPPPEPAKGDAPEEEAAAADTVSTDAIGQGAEEGAPAASSLPASPCAPHARSSPAASPRSGQKTERGQKLGCPKCRYAKGGCVRCRKWVAARLEREGGSVAGLIPVSSPGKGKRERAPGSAGALPTPKKAKARPATAPAKGVAAAALSPWQAQGAAGPGHDQEHQPESMGEPGGASAAAAANPLPSLRPKHVAAGAAAASPTLAQLQLPAAAAAGSSTPKSAAARLRVAKPQLRDVLRGLINKLKLAVPALKGVNTPNDTPGLKDLATRLFGDALPVEEQRGRTWAESMAALLSWAKGSPISTYQAQACFPTVQSAAGVPVNKVDLEALASLGLDPQHWQVPLTQEQVRSLPAPPTTRAPPPASPPAAAAAPAASPAGEPSLLPALALLPDMASVDKSKLRWQACNRGPNCVKPLGHKGWCTHSVEGAASYLAAGGPLAGDGPLFLAAQYSAERATRAALPAGAAAGGTDLAGRWCAEKGRWVLGWEKCGKELHCVKPAGHASMCIRTAEGARTFLAGQGVSPQAVNSGAQQQLPQGPLQQGRAGLDTEQAKRQRTGRRGPSGAWAAALLAMEQDSDEEQDEASASPPWSPTANSKQKQLNGIRPSSIPGLLRGLRRPSSASATVRQAMLAAPLRVRGAASAPGSRAPSAAGAAAAAAAATAAVQESGGVLDQAGMAALRDRPPQYVHVQQNVWVSKRRPKRLPRDEIPVCNCRVGPSRVAMSARQLMAATSQQQRTPSPIPALEAVAAPMPCFAAAAAAAPDSLEWDAAAASAFAAGAAGAAAALAVGGAPQLGLEPAATAADPEAALAKRLVSVAFAAAVAAVDGASAAPAPALPAAATTSTQQLLRTRSSSTNVSGMAPAGAAVAATVMSTRRGAPVGLPLAPAAAAPSEAALPPPARDGCGENCLNRLSFIHCDTRTCPCGERCSNRPFYGLDQPATEAFLTMDKGWGVRAMGPIPRGTFVVEYAGEVIDDKECQRRAEEAKRRDEPHFYMMEMAPGQIIDARVKGNFARLLNSSCDPNCETQKWHDASNGEIRVGIFTLRDIEPGEELTYDYQFQHFGLAAAAGAYLCKCGAANCRGTMDTQPERTKDFGRRIEVWWPSDQVWYPGFVTGYSASTKRHTIKYDDGDVERICLQAERYRWLDEYSQPVGSVHEPELVAMQPQQARRKKAQASGAKRRTSVSLPVLESEGQGGRSTSPPVQESVGQGAPSASLPAPEPPGHGTPSEAPPVAQPMDEGGPSGTQPEPADEGMGTPSDELPGLPATAGKRSQPSPGGAGSSAGAKKRRWHGPQPVATAASPHAHPSAAPTAAAMLRGPTGMLPGTLAERQACVSLRPPPLLPSREPLQPPQQPAPSQPQQEQQTPQAAAAGPLASSEVPGELQALLRALTGRPLHALTLSQAQAQLSSTLPGLIREMRQAQRDQLAAADAAEAPVAQQPLPHAHEQEVRPSQPPVQPSVLPQQHEQLQPQQPQRAQQGAQSPPGALHARPLRPSPPRMAATADLHAPSPANPLLQQLPPQLAVRLVRMPVPAQTQLVARLLQMQAAFQTTQRLQLQQVVGGGGTLDTSAAPPPTVTIPTAAQPDQAQQQGSSCEGPSAAPPAAEAGAAAAVESSPGSVEAWRLQVPLGEQAMAQLHAVHPAEVEPVSSGVPASTRQLRLLPLVTMPHPAEPTEEIAGDAGAGTLEYASYCAPYPPLIMPSLPGESSEQRGVSEGEAATVANGPQAVESDADSARSLPEQQPLVAAAAYAPLLMPSLPAEDSEVQQGGAGVAAEASTATAEAPPSAALASAASGGQCALLHAIEAPTVQPSGVAAMELELLQEVEAAPAQLAQPSIIAAAGEPQGELVPPLATQPLPQAPGVAAAPQPEATAVNEGEPSGQATGAAPPAEGALEPLAEAGSAASSEAAVPSHQPEPVALEQQQPSVAEGGQREPSELLQRLRALTNGRDPRRAALMFRFVEQQLLALSRALSVEAPDPEVLNPGAEQTAGKLHGNGKGSMPPGHRAGVSRGVGGARGRPAASGHGTRSRRATRPPSRPYGDDFEHSSLDPSDSEGEEEQYVSEDEEEYQLEEEEEEDDQPESPPRRYNAEARQRAAVAASMSPATQAAATIAALAGPPGQPGVAGPPSGGGAAAAVSAGSAGAVGVGAAGRPLVRRAPPPVGLAQAPAQPSAPAAFPGGAGGAAPRPGRRHPTPPSTGLPARTILVAKKLTNSDVTKGRILLPRAAVEANLSFAIGRAHSLAAQDHLGRGWEFTLQSWANGMESRRVYVLEHAGEFVRAHALKPEDVIGISTTEEGTFLIEYNTDEVCNAAETQAAARPGQAGHSPLVPGGAAAHGAAGHNPLISQNAGRCARSEFCNKPAGHPGFCTRTPAGAAASAGRGRSRPASSAAASRAQAAATSAAAVAAADGAAVPPNLFSGGRGGGLGGPPGAKRPHRLLAQAELVVGQGGGGLLEAGRPKRARKLTEKAAAMGDIDDEEEEGGDVESGYETPSPTGHQQAAAAAAGPAQDGAHPPIFVMAPSNSAPSPGGPLRSPVSRHPSGNIPIASQAAATLPAMAAASAGLRGMGKLIPSPVQPPVLSPLPALNGPAPIPAIPPSMVLNHLAQQQAQQQVQRPSAPAVDVAAFLVGNNSPEDELAAAARQQQQAATLQSAAAAPLGAPKPRPGAGPGPSAVAAGQQHQHALAGGFAPPAAQLPVTAQLGLTLPLPAVAAGLARTPDLNYFAQQAHAAAAAAYASGAAAAAQQAQYLPAFATASAPAVPPAAAASAEQAAAAQYAAGAAAEQAAAAAQYGVTGQEYAAGAEQQWVDDGSGAPPGRMWWADDGYCYLDSIDGWRYYWDDPSQQWLQYVPIPTEEVAAADTSAAAVAAGQEDAQQAAGYAPADAAYYAQQYAYQAAAAAAAAAPGYQVPVPQVAAAAAYPPAAQLQQQEPSTAAGQAQAGVVGAPAAAAQAQQQVAQPASVPADPTASAAAAALPVAPAVATAEPGGAPTGVAISAPPVVPEVPQPAEVKQEAGVTAVASAAAPAPAPAAAEAAQQQQQQQQEPQQQVEPPPGQATAAVPKAEPPSEQQGSSATVLTAVASAAATEVKQEGEQQGVAGVKKEEGKGGGAPGTAKPDFDVLDWLDGDDS